MPLSFLEKMWSLWHLADYLLNCFKLFHWHLQIPNEFCHEVISDWLLTTTLKLDRSVTLETQTSVKAVIMRIHAASAQSTAAWIRITSGLSSSLSSCVCHGYLRNEFSIFLLMKVSVKTNYCSLEIWQPTSTKNWLI